jgi:hypothetical protein
MTKPSFPRQVSPTSRKGTKEMPVDSLLAPMANSSVNDIVMEGRFFRVSFELFCSLPHLEHWQVLCTNRAPDLDRNGKQDILC